MMENSFQILLAFQPIKENPNIFGLKGFFPSSSSVEEITGLSFITSTVKDIRESKEKKVEKITAILDTTRLKPLQGLAKATASNKEEKNAEES